VLFAGLAKAWRRGPAVLPEVDDAGSDAAVSLGCDGVGCGGSGWPAGGISL